MKTNFLLFVCAFTLLASCTSAYKTGQTPDDVYYSPEPKYTNDNDSVEVKKERRRYTRNTINNNDNYDRDYNTRRYNNTPNIIIINPQPQRPKAITKSTVKGNTSTNNTSVDYNPKSNPRPKESGIVRFFKAISSASNNNSNNGSNGNNNSSTPSRSNSASPAPKSSSAPSGGGSAPVRTFKTGG